MEYWMIIKYRNNYVSEIVQLIEITPFLVEHVSCSPDGIMEWWNIGILV
jgi:hypothetical protein